MAEGPIHQPQQDPSRCSFVIDAIINMRNDKDNGIDLCENTSKFVPADELSGCEEMIDRPETNRPRNIQQ